MLQCYQMGESSRGSDRAGAGRLQGIGDESETVRRHRRFTSRRRLTETFAGIRKLFGDVSKVSEVRKFGGFGNVSPIFMEGVLNFKQPWLFHIHLTEKDCGLWNGGEWLSLQRNAVARPLE